MMFSEYFIISSFTVTSYDFPLFMFPISIVQMPKYYYTFPYKVKNRFTGMFLVVPEGSNVYNIQFSYTHKHVEIACEATVT